MSKKWMSANARQTGHRTLVKSSCAWLWALCAWLVLLPATQAIAQVQFPADCSGGGLSYWNGGGTLDWFTGGNWSPTGVPGTSNQAHIRGAPYPELNAGHATPCSLWVGDGFGAGELRIGVTGSLSTSKLDIGFDSQSTGLMIVEGQNASLNVQGATNIGRRASGRLELLDRTQVQLQEINVGSFLAGSEGSLLVHGPNTRLQGTKLRVDTNSTLELREGAKLDLVESLTLAGTGSRALVRDADTRSEAESLTIAGTGMPEFILRDQATQVVSGPVTIGLGEGSGGILHIGKNASSPGSLLTPEIRSSGGDTTLEFDHHASDLMLLDQDGQPTRLDGPLKLRHRGIGSTRITGSNLRDAWTWVHSGTLIFDGNLNSSSEQRVIVGDAAGDDGNLHLVNGAILETRSGRIGRASGSIGEVQLSDGSSWNLPCIPVVCLGGSLEVGSGGDGTLRIQGGSTVSSNSSTVGSQTGSVGAVRVAGTGSVWEMGQLVIGSEGSGELNIRNGGRVTTLGGTGSVRLAEFSGSGGLLSIGSGQAPGVLDANEVNGGIGAATVLFNHDSTSYNFRNVVGDPIGLSGSLMLDHVGSGTTRLFGPHSHSGETRIFNGRLIINGHLSQSPITVFDGGVLAGNLDSDESVLVKTGGRLAPGDGAGWMTLQSLEMWGLSQLNMQLGPAGLDHLEDQDLLIVDGPVSLGGAQLRVATLPNFSPGTHLLMQYTPGQGVFWPGSVLIEELPEGIDPNQTSLDWSVPGELRLHTVALPSAALLQFMPDELIRDFGVVAVNQSSDLMEISIQSTGGADLVVSSVSIQGQQASAFELEFESCTAAAIAASQACLVGLRFAPELAQDHLATLRIESNAIGGLHQLTLLGTGSGVSPELTVNRQGQGTVSSQPAGIDCGESCSALFPQGTPVILSATPEPRWRFAGWGADCSGELDCELVMDSDKLVEATFVLQRTLLLDVNGEGHVVSTPAGIDCGTGGPCVTDFDEGSLITLNAVPSPGWALSGWSGAGAACGNVSPCTLSLDQNSIVGAQFVQDITTLIIEPEVLDFGTWPVGSGVNSLFFTIENPNPFTVHLDSISPAEPPFEDHGGTCPNQGITLAAGASCTRAYGFAPTEPAQSQQLIQIAGGGIGGAVRTVTLQGNSLPGTRVLTVSTLGQGQVTSQPAGIDCGQSCQAAFDLGTELVLTAQPDPGWLLVSWGGDAAACGNAQQCTITMDDNLSVGALFADPGSPILAVVPTLRDFNQVQVGSTSAPRTITIGNPGSIDLEITAIGAVNAPFATVGGSCATPPFTLAPGASCTRQFSFTPIVAGEASTVFEISSNAPTNPVRAVTLRGIGFQPQANLTVVPQGQGTVVSSPAGIDCGNDCQAQFERDSQITLTATPEPGWVLSTWGGVAAGCGSASECSITLDQNRTAGALFVNAANPVLGVAPGLLNFRRVPVGSIEGALTVTIGNPGGATLEITGIGEVSAPFEPAGGSCAAAPFSLAPGASCTLQFSFAPTEPGPASSEFEISSNAPVNRDRTVTLQGLGIQPQARLTVVTSGQGVVSSDPEGIDCGADGPCQGLFEPGSQVSLTAEPGPGWVFVTWGGAAAACGNALQCTVTLDQNRTVGALFQLSDDRVFSDRFQF